jgi:hypothetical protein
MAGEHVMNVGDRGFSREDLASQHKGKVKFTKLNLDDNQAL